MEKNLNKSVTILLLSFSLGSGWLLLPSAQADSATGRFTSTARALMNDKSNPRIHINIHDPRINTK